MGGEAGASPLERAASASGGGVSLSRGDDARCDVRIKVDDGLTQRRGKEGLSKCLGAVCAREEAIGKMGYGTGDACLDRCGHGFVEPSLCFDRIDGESREVTARFAGVERRVDADRIDLRVSIGNPASDGRISPKRCPTMKEFHLNPEPISLLLQGAEMFDAGAGLRK